MNILVPIQITDTMLTSATLPEDGTAAWVSGTYAVGDLRHVVATHRVYKCAVAGVSAVSPELDPTRWGDDRPTNKWAPFDAYVSTGAVGVTFESYVLQPGFFNAASLYGLVGAAASFVVKNAPGGSVIFSYSGDLFEQSIGLYELLFQPPLARDKLVLSDIPISPTAEITVTVTAASGDPVGLGMLNIGDLRPVIGAAEWGGTEYGAGAEPKSFSYIKFFEDGTSVIKRRGSATDMRGSVAMPAASAAYALATIQQVLDVPVSCIATTAEGYAYLNVFGLISATVTADSAGSAKLNFNVKGSI